MTHVCSECGLRYPEAGACPRDGGQVTFAADPLLGTRVGSYRLTRVIGQGGMGRVYAAIQPELGNMVAVKVMADEHATNRELTQRFLAEARAITMIRHESIVNVLDLQHLPDGRPVIVMELIDGQTLRELVHASLPSIGGVVAVMMDVLSALATAHAAGVIHRDLKPDNILVTTSGRGKVLDFGIAKLMMAAPGHPALRTRTGVVLGTPEYMSPEQISSGTADQRTDIYAAGVVLFEAVTGHRPFVGSTDFDVMRQHVDMPPPSPRAMRPELPDQIEQVILCALAKRPSDRFGNATAMANALHSASAMLSTDQRRPLTPSSISVRRPLLPGPDAESSPTAVEGAAASYVTVRATPGGRLDQATKQVSEGARTRPSHPDALRPTVSAQRASGPEMPYESTHPAARRSALPAQRSRWPLAMLGLAGAGGVVAVVVVLAARRPAAPHAEVPPDAELEVVAAAVPPVVTPPIDAPPVAPLPADAAVATTPAPLPPRPPPISKKPRPPTPRPDPPTVATSAVPEATPGSVMSMMATANYPLKGDPKSFDPNAYLGEAKRLARTMLPDSELTKLEFEVVGANGRVDLTLPRAAVTFAFVSPAQQKARRADLPPNVGDMRKCLVNVEVTAAGIEVEMIPSEFCEKYHRPFATPKCSTKELWKRAEIKGVDPKLVATISAESHKGEIAWTFDVNTFGTDDLHLRDDCGAIAPGQTVPDGAPKITETKNGEKRFIVPLSIDRAKFDALAFSKTALVLARKLQPDARLTEVELQPIKSNGQFPYYKRKDSNDTWRLRYSFHADKAPVIDGKRSCYLLVMVDAQLTEAEVINTPSTSCSSPRTFAPRCTLTGLWKKMIDAGADPDKPAWIHWDGTEWELSGTGKADGNDRFFREFPDDCK